MLIINAEPIKGHDLKPGDLFSTRGPQYWNDFYKRTESLGESVYIRTQTPASYAPDSDTLVYKITIKTEGDTHEMPILQE